jgi:hypothetical protein
MEAILQDRKAARAMKNSKQHFSLLTRTKMRCKSMAMLALLLMTLPVSLLLIWASIAWELVSLAASGKSLEIVRRLRAALARERRRTLGTAIVSGGLLCGLCPDQGMLCYSMGINSLLIPTGWDIHIQQSANSVGHGSTAIYEVGRWLQAQRAPRGSMYADTCTALDGMSCSLTSTGALPGGIWKFMHGNVAADV